MVKVLDVVNYTNNLVGQSIDEDGAFGSQCMDLTVHIMKRFFGWHPTGNAINLTFQTIPSGFKRMQIVSSSEIKAGDILVWGLGSFAAYGHTAIAVENGSSNGTFVSVDQNWVNPSLEVGSPAARIVHNLNGVWGVIRPNYEKEAPEQTKKEEEFLMWVFYQANNNVPVRWFNGEHAYPLAHADERKAINDIYKANTGKDVPFLTHWKDATPYHNRLANVLNRKADF
ncbi:CHAP domain-containing protein [Enterococcus sp. 5H]|uniref:CHAP domain-containing protein n=1 Tax=Enterococcus sp. 5H TaxID=1229490 RepID=UPI00230228B7|nr:CHAP domain-containing protein [Enterococcus sp. 5H]MDA9472266.1 hypothetical protein [Enterococcus sp. 5H]